MTGRRGQGVRAHRVAGRIVMQPATHYTVSIVTGLARMSPVNALNTGCTRERTQANHATNTSRVGW